MRWMRPTISNMLLLYCVIATLGLALLPELGAFALFPYEYYDTFFSREFILSVVLFQFLHGGIFHLLMNTVFLYIYGNLIEMLLWKKLYLLFFVLSTVIVTATITIFSSAPTIGLSGFTVALLAFLFMGLRSTNHPEAKAAWLFLIINILAWLYQHVSFSWHFGWAIAGVVFYILLQLIHLKRR